MEAASTIGLLEKEIVEPANQADARGIRERHARQVRKIHPDDQQPLRAFGARARLDITTATSNVPSYFRLDQLFIHLDRMNGCTKEFVGAPKICCCRRPVDDRWIPRNCADRLSLEI